MAIGLALVPHEMKVVEQICDKVAVVHYGEVVESGDVRDIFLNPQSKVTRSLLFPQKEGFETAENQKVFRLSFDGQSSNEPVIANLVLECQAKVNILGASTEDVDGKAYGQMLIAIPEDEMKVARVKNYLSEIGVHVTEIDN